MPHNRESALKVHRNNVVPLLLCHVVKHPVTQDAGDSNYDVNAAELVLCRFDDALPTVPSRNGIGRCDCVATSRNNVIYYLLGDRCRTTSAVQFSTDVIHDHTRPICRQFFGDSPTDASPGTSDYCDFSL